MPTRIIETIDLTKIYKLKKDKRGIAALNKVNLSINEGEIFGLLGPNGAGKTTMVSILTTLISPTSGYALIDGINIVKNPKRAKLKVALMLENEMLYHRITGYDNLKFFCKLYLIKDYKDRINSLAKDFGLDKWLNEYVENYSSGMKMKLALLKTIILDRQILFLDEPTLGLDVKSINFVVEKLKSLDKTIFLTSHDMSVVEKLCNRIAFINHGKILKVGTKEDIKRLETTEINFDVEIMENKSKLKSELNQKEFITNLLEIENGLVISLKSRNYFKDFLQILSKYNVLSIKEQEISLEDLFIKFT
ncbi:MAG: ABC transporter ATP-binding protein [Promethearchaeota archaeon]